MTSIEQAEALIAKGVDLLSEVPPGLLEHVIEFVEGIATGDKSKAERAATLATTESTFNRSRGAQ